jgi:uncharacterized protein (TIGR00290 family)
MWSGGKDCALALDRAHRAGIDVQALINLHDGATRRVRFHATGVEMLEAQASLLGIDLIKVPTTWSEMDQNLRERLTSLRTDGFAGVLFGNIHLVDVRAWYEERVVAAGLEHLEPIWGEAPDALLEEFVDRGGRAVVTCVDRTRLDASWLGRIVDEEFCADIGATGCDPCGENGEYHSFVVAGPVFAAPVAWTPGVSFEEGPFLQLDIQPKAGSSTPVL